MNLLTNILLFFISILILLMAFVAVNVYVNKLTTKDLQSYLLSPFKESVNIKKNKIDEVKKPTTWSSILASKEIPNFSYPSPEVFITLDFSNVNKTDILQIINLDSYKLFCLKEILKSNNIKFTYIQNSNVATLEVALINLKQRQNLISELKRYNIAYHIKKG
ncbi:hypothetical protein [Helicobacter sp. MIT 14-3879]|uniref:hypothetical protein n=1 Tax=Helicobacter sp. MIT 14-3879 TaxID=2040649 RepID=UPI000E1FA88F|nr:hypothetical protein [Helicobacter sp. MIT 14-3879]RDU64161.1 hypothetical protein CQA44_04345 [Helicobacter sp. MIT 14-3879]